MSELNKQILVIEAGAADRNYWRDLWKYRELFLVLAWRDVSVRYKQTVVGLAWALIRPFITMIVFTVIFGNLAKLPSEGAAPYALMVYAGLLPWQFFSQGLADVGNSMVVNSHLVSKVYFPRMIVPVSTLVVSLIDFLISFIILVGLMLWFLYAPGWQILFLPFFLIMAVLAAIGPGLWLSSLNVKYRDFRYIIPFILQLGMYLSPVGFSSSVVPEQWRLLYSLNPMVGVIDGFRWSILGNEANFYMPGFILSWLIIGFFLWLGIRQFRKTEKTFADII
ncbi:MAG: ABC transporter permease [Rhizobiales bacterium]|nr:ABC transporter permease [Hyphomicrobiales bacterium]